MTKEQFEGIRERVLEETAGIPVKDILGPDPGAATSWIEQLLSDRAALLAELDMLMECCVRRPICYPVNL